MACLGVKAEPPATPGRPLVPSLPPPTPVHLPSLPPTQPSVGLAIVKTPHQNTLGGRNARERIRDISLYVNTTAHLATLRQLYPRFRLPITEGVLVSGDDLAAGVKPGQLQSHHRNMHSIHHATVASLIQIVHLELRGVPDHLLRMICLEGIGERTLEAYLPLS